MYTTILQTNETRTTWPLYGNYVVGPIKERANRKYKISNGYEIKTKNQLLCHSFAIILFCFDIV